jgi:heme-degrading monooxygenase HmoA
MPRGDNSSYTDKQKRKADSEQNCGPEVDMFVAVYWWKVKPGKEAQFRKAWRRGTQLIQQIYGSFGSRLHRDADGRFVGYAEWPDEATWRAAFDRGMAYDEPATRAAFLDAVLDVPAHDDPIFTMTVTDDLLLRSSDGNIAESADSEPRTAGTN